MQTLTYPGGYDPAGLHDAILAAHPELAGTYSVTERIVREIPTETQVEETQDDGSTITVCQYGLQHVAEQITREEVLLRVESDGSTITVTIPDDFNAQLIDTLVAGYTPPAPPESPAEKLLADLDAAADLDAMRAALANYAQTLIPQT
jgi:hypothetical protein